MARHLKVRLIDCSAEDQKKLKKIFHLSTSRGSVYTFVDEIIDVKPDLLIIDIDSDSSKKKQETLQAKYPSAQIVTKSKHDSVAANHIKGALLATRVLRILDKIVFPETHESPVAQTNDNAKHSKEEIIAEQEVTEQEIEDTSDQQQDISSFNVLVVDDSPLMQKTIGLELKDAAIKINTDYADSGEQALEMVNSKIYDFIFLDVMMPGIDGFETCTLIRKKQEMKKTPIIMLSAKTSPLDEVKGVIAGCSTYLTKPIEHEAFQELLERVMGWLKDFV